MTATATTGEKPTNVRYLVLAALASGAILSYLLRVSISSAGTTIQRELTITDTVMGDVFAAFFLGYFWFQIPGGWVGHRFGARVSLAVMGLLWAGGTVLSSQAHSATLLYLSRIALGVAQAGLFPVTIMAIRDWFPPGRRGLASSVITACMSMGAVIASALTTRMLVRIGWRETFLIYGCIAAAWAVGMFVWFRNSPSENKSVNQAELDLIQDHSAEAANEATPLLEAKPHAPRMTTGAALLAMLSTPSMWALNAQGFFQAFAYGVFITWFPAYLEKGRGLSVTRAGDLTMLPLLAVVVGSVIGGFLIDLILKRTGRKWLSRSVFPAAGLTVCAVATASASLLTDPLQAVAAIALGMFFTGMAMPGKWACSIDLTAAYSSIGFAMMNMSGNIGAWVCPKVVGRMFESLKQGGGDWNSFLYLIAVVELAAAVSCFVLNPNKPAIGADS